MLNSLLFLLFLNFFMINSHANVAFPLSHHKLHEVQQDLILKAFNDLKSKSQLSEKETEKLEIYSLTQNLIENVKIEEANLKSFSEKKINEQKRIKQLTLELSKLTFLPEKYQKLNETVDVNTLNKTQETLNAVQIRLQSQSVKLNHQMADIHVIKDDNDKKLAVNQKRLEYLKKQLEQLRLDATISLSEQKRLYITSEMWFIDINNQVLIFEDEYNPLHLKRLELEQKIVDIEKKYVQQQSQIIQILLNKKRKEISENLIKTTEKSSEQQQEAVILRKLSAENVELSQFLLAITANISDFTQRLELTHAKFNMLTNIQQDVEKQSNLLGKSVLFSRTLRESLMNLPSVFTQSKLLHLLEQVRLDKFQYDQKIDQLTNSKNFLKTFEPMHNLSKREENEATALIEHRKKLLEKLSEDSEKLISALLALEVEQKKLNKLRHELSAWLKQKLFWINSSPTMNFTLLLNLPKKLWSEIKAILFTQDMIELVKMIQSHWLLLLVSLILLLSLKHKKNQFLKWEKSAARRIGHIKGDSLWLTPWSLLLALISVLPIPLWIIIFASLALVFHSTLCTLAYSLLLASIASIFSSFWLYVLKPSGIAQLHFQWPAEYCAIFEKNLRKLSRLLIPMTFFVVLAENQSFELDEDILGMLLITLGTLIQGFYIWKLLRTVKHLIGSKLLHHFISFLLPAMSIAQAILTMLGYYYTALVLEYQILSTLLLIGVFALLHSLAIRSLHIGEHRLAYQRAIQKYGQNKAKGFEEPTLDLATINQQSLRLLNVTLFVGFIIAFYWVWKNFADFFSILSTIQLWSFHINNSIHFIQLGDLCLAIIIFVSTVILTRNLPGLLEVTLLSKLHIRQGNTYAVLKLLSYSIASLGFILTLANLGFSWDKLQWLIAAIGLGVSIGLKEIFANILSGLIILFEQPIRIGDTISFGVGDHQLIGEVSRIRIRASTILDWDHKEIIIPNSMILNEKLINWSLSDSIVRIILPFYIEHKTDCPLVEKLILQAAQENPNTVDNPISNVTLMQYGDSALLYELRTYISHVKHRLSIISEINTRVTILFNEHGIKVAPPKQFLYLKRDEALKTATSTIKNSKK